MFDDIALPPRGNEYIFLAKYDPSGTVQYVKQYAAGLAKDIYVLNDGCLYFSGGNIHTYCNSIPNGHADADSNANGYTNPNGNAAAFGTTKTNAYSKINANSEVSPHPGSTLGGAAPLNRFKPNIGGEK